MNEEEIISKSRNDTKQNSCSIDTLTAAKAA